MGKIYKNPNPPIKDIQSFIQDPQENISPKYDLNPQGHVIPLRKFDEILIQAEKKLHDNYLSEALQDLLNLEISNFNNIHVHELLADLYLKQNNLTLAKEQCQICAYLIEQETPSNIFNLKTFEELIAEVDSIENAEKAYKELIDEKIDNSNFHKGTKVVLGLATLRMAENRYQEAAEILITYRDRYLEFINKD